MMVPWGTPILGHLQKMKKADYLVLPSSKVGKETPLASLSIPGSDLGSSAHHDFPLPVDLYSQSRYGASINGRSPIGWMVFKGKPPSKIRMITKGTPMTSDLGNLHMEIPWNIHH